MEVGTNQKATPKVKEAALVGVSDTWRGVCMAIATELQDNPAVFIWTS